MFSAPENVMLFVVWPLMSIAPPLLPVMLLAMLIAALPPLITTSVPLAPLMAPALAVKAPKIDVSLIASFGAAGARRRVERDADVVGSGAGDVDDLARAGLGEVA